MFAIACMRCMRCMSYQRNISVLWLTMAERGIRASSEGIRKAKKVVKDLGWTQIEIGEEVGKSRQPVGKFLAGKPIERSIFIDICRLLDLNWEEIAEPEPEEQKQDTSIDIAALVQEVREKIKPIIQEHCGTMRVLDKLLRS